jgi:hypothetical protein
MALAQDFLREFQPPPFIQIPFLFYIQPQQLTESLNKKIID